MKENKLSDKTNFENFPGSTRRLYYILSMRLQDGNNDLLHFGHKQAYKKEDFNRLESGGYIKIFEDLTYKITKRIK